MSWRRVLNRPKRGVGATSEQNLAAWAARNRQPFSAAIRNADTVLAGTPAVKRLQEFSQLMDDLAQAAEELPAATFLSAVLIRPAT